MSLPVDLLAKATAWRDQDPDAATRAELDALIAAARAGDAEPLVERFSSPPRIRHRGDCAASSGPAPPA